MIAAVRVRVHVLPPGVLQDGRFWMDVPRRLLSTQSAGIDGLQLRAKVDAVSSRWIW